jgi:predicted nucleic acid-binding protein
MTVLIDTNIALDVLLERRPFYQEALRIMVLSEKKLIQSYLSATAITDVYYFTNKQLQDKATALALLKNLLQTVSPAAVSNENIYQALDLDWSDFEDSVQYVTGRSIAADYIITRNPRDFSRSTIAIVTPTQFLDSITAN